MEHKPSMKHKPLYAAVLLALALPATGALAQPSAEHVAQAETVNRSDLGQQQSAAEQSKRQEKEKEKEKEKKAEKQAQEVAALADSQEPDFSELDAIPVYGEAIAIDGLMTDQQAYDAVYDEDYSSDYIGKKRIDTYRGTNPADLLGSFAGVYSGDARNSGAIDPNIRGFQSQERVKVRVDGTEQALAVYRGYNGMSNRNYIDPLLTAGMRVVKDSGLDTGVHTGVAGGIDIRTLGVNDFIGAEGGFGADIRLEGSSNATDPRIGKDWDGTRLVDMPGWKIVGEKLDFAKLTPPKWQSESGSSFVQEHRHKSGSDEQNMLNGKDYAARLALGYRAENWDVMGAIARRSRGNYFSGKKGKGFYDNPLTTLNPDRPDLSWVDTDFIRSLARYYPAGGEVFNTSNAMDSYLFKLGIQPTPEQKIALSLRNSKTTYGEIMPSRTRQWVDDKTGIQWPLSHVDLKAWGLQYHLQPKDSKWLNLHANLWMTDTDSNLYNSGGDIENAFDSGTGYPQGMTEQFNYMDYANMTWKLEPLQDDVMLNNAKIRNQHRRTGVDVSNRMRLSNRVNLTLFGSMQKEKLQSHINHWEKLREVAWTQLPREGRRQEYSAGFNVNWQATDRLTLDIGAKHSSYWIHDDFLARMVEEETEEYLKGKAMIPSTTAILYEYKVKTEEGFLSSLKQMGHNSAEEYGVSRWTHYKGLGSNSVFYKGALKDFERAWKRHETMYPGTPKVTGTPKDPKSMDDPVVKDWLIRYYAANIRGGYGGETGYIEWKRDAQGRLSRATNPCLNGSISKIEGIQPNKDKDLPCPGTMISGTTTYAAKEVRKVRDSSWVPAIAASYRLSDSARVYARYNESVRYPSTFEGLIGFSGTRSLQPLRPEHSHKAEIGYVQNLLPWFDKAEAADLKVAYYENRIKDLIDRAEIYKFSNFDKKKIRGIELQARYDGGRFFGDLGLHYILQNDLCDENSIAFVEAIREGEPRRAALKRPPMQRCVRDGHYNTFTLTHAVPRLSVKMHLGARFMQRRLEMGTRLTWYNQVDNKDYDNYLWRAGQHPTVGRGQNPVYGWGNTMLIDAYVRYRLDEKVSIELSGNNLGDRYYLDPATRTAVPGPGRTLKLSMNVRF